MLNTNLKIKQGVLSIINSTKDLENPEYYTNLINGNVIAYCCEKGFFKTADRLLNERQYLRLEDCEEIFRQLAQNKNQTEKGSDIQNFINAMIRKLSKSNLFRFV